jgi:glucose-6-phosphate isomerase
MDHIGLWKRYKKYHLAAAGTDVTLDVSRMRFTDAFLQQKDYDIRRAFEDMDQLEAGAQSNPDERRMVGHYWLRAPERAPNPVIKEAIESAHLAIKKFARAVHTGKVKPPRATRFRRLLVVGIGGSALGPQFVSRALTSVKKDKLTPYFLDNTDPDGFDLVLDTLGPALKETLVIVISKSGGTKETRNGMLEVKAAFKKAKLAFPRQAVAITQAGSELDKVADAEGWLARFPMWDWVGGRTSELSAVGLLPAALQGLDWQAMLEGARAMDQATRLKDPLKNPAALMALMWMHGSGGKGLKDLVVLPYKDRLELFSRYLQQLVMESLGKGKDLTGAVVNQGLTVYGNKGSTDQHAYVQQLREGVNNFFVTFVQVLRDRAVRSMDVEDGLTSGDYLCGFLHGTRRALHEAERESMTLTVPVVNARVVGQLMALFERTVGLYAFMVKVNAYHQPGVEAGKKAAAGFVSLQKRVVEALMQHKGEMVTAEQLAGELTESEQVETVFHILQHLAANPDRGVTVKVPAGGSVFDATYGA